MNHDAAAAFPVIIPALLDYPIFIGHALELFAQGKVDLAIETLRALRIEIAHIALILGVVVSVVG